MNLSLKSTLLALTLTFGAFASAETLTGTVKNGTTNKPAAGDEVILIKLGNGMEEAGRTKADAKGNFSFNVGEQGPHLVRVVHQGVTYHRMAPPGTTSVEVEVNDVAKKVDGVSLTADVMRIQVEQNQMEVMRLFVVNNESKPPKTQMNDHNFEFFLPEGAKIVQSSATTAGGNPLNSNPVPQSEKNRYAYLFPLRPGETRFELAYSVPYSGSANIDPKSVYGMQHFVVMIPKAMQFEAGPGAHFDSMNDPQQADATVQVATMTQPSQPLSFKISGSGMLANSTAPQGSQNGGAMGGPASASTSGPGGGLGPPIDAPDPLQKYRWWIIGGFAIALTGGAYYVTSRQPGRVALPQGGVDDITAPVPSRASRVTASIPNPRNTASIPVATPAPAAVAAAPALTAAAPARPSMLLEALKEELFQLEVEHKQGKITQQEYEKAKAALDGTLERAIKRDMQKA